MMRYGFDLSVPRPLRTLCRCGQRATRGVPQIVFGASYTDYYCDACWQRLIDGDEPSSRDPRVIAALIAAYDESKRGEK